MVRVCLPLEISRLSEPFKVIAILAANPALSSILTMVVGGDTRLRVREFGSDIELIAYMRLAPVDILVCDFDREEGRPAYEMVEFIRLDGEIVSGDVQVIALSRTITPPMRHQAISAGIDEVIIKPMSPRHLLERIRARLRPRPTISAPTGYRGPDRRNRAPLQAPSPMPTRRQADNVVQLFPDHGRSGLEQ
jgi:two-component system, OmpR family, phosphate regulon response regulator PhoB